MSRIIKGPFSYENWKAFNADATIKYEEEYTLFTDAGVTGGIDGECGPYKLLNTVPTHSALRRACVKGKEETPFGTGRLSPSIVLRAAIHADYEHPSLQKSDTTLYHGGGLCDEIAALVSLSLGIRLKAGPQTREFWPGHDPKGLPQGPRLRLDPVLSTQTADATLIPDALKDHSLNDEIRSLKRLNELTTEDATAVVRAARSYQEAIWVADSDPALSWLMFVTAAEIAALNWDKTQYTPIEKLTTSQAPLAKLLKEKCGEDVLQEVAEVFANHKGVLNKFLKFMIEFLPDPPQKRATLEQCRCSWSSDDMRKYMKVIYDHRSRALHDGTPIPYPMCIPSNIDTWAERHLSVGYSAMGGSWTERDTPMLLGTFEYIVRRALLKWWESMIPI